MSSAHPTFSVLRARSIRNNNSTPVRVHMRQAQPPWLSTSRDHSERCKKPITTYLTLRCCKKAHTRHQDYQTLNKCRLPASSPIKIQTTGRQQNSTRCNDIQTKHWTKCPNNTEHQQKRIPATQAVDTVKFFISKMQTRIKNDENKQTNKNELQSNNAPSILTQQHNSQRIFPPM